MINQNPIFEAAIARAAYWDPTSQQLFPTPVAVQPGQRGYKIKAKRFVLWALEVSGYTTPEDTVETWFDRKRFPTGWEAFFTLWLQINQPNQ